jgi:hypothetical protein
MRSMFTRWQQYLRNSLAKHSSGKEYSRTDSLKGVYISATPNERGNMSNDNNWIHDIIPRSQVEAMDKNGEAMIDNMRNGVQLMVAASNQSAIELCRAWELTKSGHEDGFETIAMFINGLVSTLEMYLRDEEIDPYEEYNELD